MAFSERNEIYDRIDDLEEDLIRLTNSNIIHYDESFHKEIMRKYSSILSDTRLSNNMSDSEKETVYELMKETFKENLIMG